MSETLEAYAIFDTAPPLSIPLDDIILSPELQVRHPSLEEVSLVLKESLNISADEARFKRIVQGGNIVQDEDTTGEKTAAQFCERFFTQASESSTLPNSIDNAVLKALGLHSYSDSKLTLGFETIVSRAHHLLSRLPVTSQQMSLNFDADFQPRGLHASGDSTARPWLPTRSATSALICWSKTIIRMALHIVCEDPTSSRAAYITQLNSIGRWLEGVVNRLTQSTDTTERQIWFAITTFLWATWHRAQLLRFWSVLVRHLLEGYSEALDLFTRIDELDIKVDESSRSSKAEYMCNWAFNLLQADPSARGQDFRTFHKRYRSLWGTRPARCNGNMACSGLAASQCQRFVGAEILDQSAHDSLTAHTCYRMYWEESSYRSVEGAKAVCIATSSADRLRYCPASTNTLVISHVWSHGQGGRPETGMNSCLHTRYSKLAKRLDCDSYWMDTSCENVPPHEMLHSIGDFFQPLMRISFFCTLSHP